MIKPSDFTMSTEILTLQQWILQWLAFARYKILNNLFWQNWLVNPETGHGLLPLTRCILDIYAPTLSLYSPHVATNELELISNNVDSKPQRYFGVPSALWWWCFINAYFITQHNRWLHRRLWSHKESTVQQDKLKGTYWVIIWPVFRSSDLRGEVLQSRHIWICYVWHIRSLPYPGGPLWFVWLSE